MLSRILQIKSFDFFLCPAEKTPQGKATPSGFIFEKLSTADLTTCSLAQEKNRLLRFQERLEKGYVCYGYCDKTSGAVIGYFWVTAADQTPVTAPFTMGADFLIQPGQAYIWDCRIEPAYQNQGLYAAGLRTLIDQFGPHEKWINCEHKNKPSRRGIQNAGFTYQNNCVLLNIRGFKMKCTKTGCARLPGQLPLR